MHRNSLQELSGRAMHGAVRLLMQGKAMDNPMWQELNFGGFIGDIRQFVERIQAFGLTSVPLPPTEQKQQSQGGQGGIGHQSVQGLAANGGGSSGGGGQGGTGEPTSPEGIAVFLGGQRDHPVVIAVDDRRHRPMGLKPGETAQYDDIQQMTLMRRNGLYMLSNDNEDAEGKKVERMASLRHVEKKKQERKTEEPKRTQQRLGRELTRVELFEAMARKAQDDKAKEDFKHEGDTVNTEVRVTKKKIEFYNGDTQVGEHDKASQKWNMKGKEFNATPADGAHINTKTVTINGSTSIAMNGPTTVNGSPVGTAATIGAFEVIKALEARVAHLEARILEMGGA